MKHSRKGGFTLIEMLVVCLIVVLLAGLVFKMVGAMGRNNDIADTRGKLEMVANALEEFKSIYGKYPPVRLYPTSRGMEPLMMYEFPQPDTYGDPDDPDAQRATAQRMIKQYKQGKMSQWDINGLGGIFSFGLCSFFVPRVNGTAANGGWMFLEPDANGNFPLMPEQWKTFNTGNEHGDSRRDLDAVRRILPLLGGRLGDDDCVVWEHNKWGNRNAGILGMPWDGYKRGPEQERTNDCVTVRDSWGRDLLYYSIPPYESYMLWSSGPDGKTSGDRCYNQAHGSDVHKGAQGDDWNGHYWVILDGDPETYDDLIAGKN